jgi:glutamate synthase (NADPH/NADH) small chain
MANQNREKMPEQAPALRRRNFQEVPLGFSAEQALREAKRCLQCKKPLCVGACPVAVPIPRFIGHIREGDFKEAAYAIWSRNSLPAVCGRVCPQENQCEGACILGKKQEAVAIGSLERFTADWAREQKDLGRPEISPPSGRKVAIVGSGPGGIIAAGDLIRKGHAVTIFEAFHQPGGVLVYGIPEFRLPKSVVASDVRFIEKMGVEIRCNQVIGYSYTIDELMNEEGYDAVYIGVGAGLPSFLNIEGENLTGVYSANEYLTRSNLMKAYLFPEYDTPLLAGRQVCVFGGGNVAMDALRTALRMGAERVVCVYRRSRQELPARAEEIHHAEEEGVEFLFLHAPLRFLDNGRGSVSGVELQVMELGQPDQSGRRSPRPIAGQVTTVACDMAIIAVGSGANPLLSSTTAGLEVNKNGYIVADSQGRTTKKGVWAGGDIVTGAATVILAAGAGRTAADSIHQYLTEL